MENATNLTSLQGIGVSTLVNSPGGVTLYEPVNDTNTTYGVGIRVLAATARRPVSVSSGGGDTNDTVAVDEGHYFGGTICDLDILEFTFEDLSESRDGSEFDVTFGINLFMEEGCEDGIATITLHDATSFEIVASSSLSRY